MPGSLQIKGLRFFTAHFKTKNCIYYRKNVEPLDKVKTDVNIKAIGLIPVCIFCTKKKKKQLLVEQSNMFMKLKLTIHETV